MYTDEAIRECIAKINASKIDWNGDYLINVDNNTVTAQEIGNSDNKSIAKCHPSDKFDIAKGVGIAMSRLYPVKVGDTVKLKENFVYPYSSDWVEHNISDTKLIIHYAFGVFEPLHEEKMFKVIKIAPKYEDHRHLYAYIQSKNGICYVADYDQLEKAFY